MLCCIPCEQRVPGRLIGRAAFASVPGRLDIGRYFERCGAPGKFGASRSNLIVTKRRAMR